VGDGKVFSEFWFHFVDVFIDIIHIHRLLDSFFVNVRSS